MKSIGLRIGIAFAMIHLCLVLLAFFAMITSRSSTAGLIFIWFGFLDAPLLFLPHAFFMIFGSFAPLIKFGLLGSTLWFLIPWLFINIYTRVFPKGPRFVIVIILLVAIPLILSGFFRLSFVAVRRSIQEERPAELKKQLNSASSDFLTGKVIFEDYAPAGVTSINRMKCRPNVGAELVVALPQGLVFLNDTYQVQFKLNLVDRKAFKSVDPIVVAGSSACEYLGYMYPEGVHLYGTDGRETWNLLSQQNGGTGTIDGVRYGDIDGDGKPEFAIYYKYREGITLVDVTGKTLWKYPVYALGHLEIADVQGDGKAQIIFDNSNNANGVTEFIVLNSHGAVAQQLRINTSSSEFALIKWPGSYEKPNILLTEESKIKIVDSNGNIVMQLNAPGCRTFGDLKAVAVKFNKKDPAYLAVRKSLHPDISVLYVYAADGKLVYQKTETVPAHLTPALAVIPSDESGAERLLVGESAPNFRARVVEYSLTRQDHISQ